MHIHLTYYDYGKERDKEMHINKVRMEEVKFTLQCLLQMV